MPELPEVEVVRRGVAEHAVGRRVSEVEVLHPRAVRRHLPGPADFEGRLTGAVLAAARRRGKYLWLELDEADSVTGSELAGTAVQADATTAMLVHLGMSGQLLVKDGAAPDEKHLRVRFRFADGGPELRFVDQRTFGGLFLAETVAVDGESLPVPLSHIGRDPMDPRFDLDAAVSAIQRRRTGIKRALLDQTLVSGVGNIYADEALWRAGLHWAYPTSVLSAADGRRVLDEAARVMRAALAAGGTSFDALYVNVNGQSGYFDRTLAVYGQEDRPCRRCGAAVRRDPFMNRSSFSCPACQPVPADAHF
ncbi:bifunctional DNA-formamidopyrimidine glycosylase/DNA-(apurinic or apyrimidinic site) lyase [Actinoalloteichus caeruleus]|uniref:bifunctional DNA-formamidopyrimidine glycosylase/DNA-(apurinic or apyrimidinic site) lyase n=1 Tax=Actinoalloteichus cyanogriseus TaxID=2893586 RepID=UPI0004AB6A38|nr:bifunctional DNA-formamidopyrimidine glycosylase/DNA-(apurinic or apyrimidinic site) lyase [Actinoalloteichus caeruleus]